MSALTLGNARLGLPPELVIDGPGGVRHLLVAGTTGAGKGSWLESVLGAAAVRADVQVFMVDPKAIDSAPWASTLAALAVTDQDIEQLAGRVASLVLSRRHLAAVRGWKEWQPSPDEPTVLFCADELARAMKVPAFAEALDLVLHLGRALGVGAVCATQQANAKAAGGTTELRSLFSCRAALFDAESAGYVFLYGKDVVSRHPDLFGWLRMDRPGLAVWSDGTGPPRLTRAFHWTRQDVDRVVAASAHLARDVDELVAVAA